MLEMTRESGIMLGSIKSTFYGAPILGLAQLTLPSAGLPAGSPIWRSCQWAGGSSLGRGGG
jgi:hypothetical protein